MSGSRKSATTSAEARAASRRVASGTRRDSWAPTQEEAEQTALKEWPTGGMPFPKQDIKNPEDFAQMAKMVRIENFANRMLISADLDEHTEALQKYIDMGFDEIYLHNVGRNQPEFIELFGKEVIPNLRLG